MSSTLLLVAWNASLLATTATIIRIRSRILFWQEHARHMQESGYLVPPSTLSARLAWRVLTKVLVYLVIGPVKVSGRENLKVKGRKIFVPNHQYELDFAMFAIGAKTACPIMTSSNVLKGRPEALIGAWTGAIPVNLEQENGGQRAYEASVKALLRRPDAEFMIFPQGALCDELQRADFKPGAARMQEDVFWATGEGVWLIPMYMEYERDPQRKPLSHHLLGKLRRMCGKVNYGGRVVIGRPIGYAAGRDVTATTSLVFTRIKNLSSGAQPPARHMTAETDRN